MKTMVEVVLTCQECRQEVVEVEIACDKGPLHRHGRCLTPACYAQMPADWAMCVRGLSRPQEKIIPVVLYCPHCKKQHVDEGIWATRPHRTHACVDDVAGKGCGKPFTPSAYRTVGILDLKGQKIEALEEPG